jgi:predicted DNA-binding transcriptional regulator YafY
MAFTLVDTMSLTPANCSRRAGLRTGESGSALGRAQLSRLFRLVLILQSERYPNARELAERCEVSRRTIYRDLDLLADAGITVLYVPERMGYQLARGVFLPPTHLEETEALALMVLSRQWEAGDGLGLLKHAWEGASKLVQGLPPDVRDRVLAAAEPFRPVSPPDETPPERRGVHEAILATITQLRQARLWYRDAATREEICTKFSLYRLHLVDREWLMVGRSTLHRHVVVIGVASVQKVVLTDDDYAIPPRFNPERYLARPVGNVLGEDSYHVWLRFSPRVNPELNDVWCRGQRRVELADGRLDLLFVTDGLDEVLRWVLGFGDQVEVLAPLELRDQLFRVAAAMARVHRPTLLTRNKG